MQYQPKEDYKIYSRPRLNLAFLKNTPKSHKSRRITPRLAMDSSTFVLS